MSLAPGACSPLLGAHHMEKLSLVGSQQSACYILLYGDARRLLAKTLAQPSVGVSPLAGFLFVTLSAKSLPPPPCSAPGSLLPVSHLTPRPCSVPPTCLLEPEVHRFLIYFPSLTQRFFLRLTHCLTTNSLVSAQLNDQSRHTGFPKSHRL